MQNYLEQLSAAWEISERVFLNYFYHPETKILAATGIEKNGKSTATSRECDTAFVWEFRFAEDGRLAYVRGYNDTVAIGGTFDKKT